MSQPSLNLTARDFDAYAPEKATSNAYSRPRLEVKQRALGWARGVVARLAEQGIAVDVHGSDEHPSLRNKKRVDSQWVFFSRDPAAREELSHLLDRGRSISDEIDDPSPYTRHAFLALRIDDHAVEVCFAVHPEAKIDVDNLHARLADGSGELAAELTRALAALPEEFLLGVGLTAEDRTPCSSATPEAIRSMLERAAAGQVPLWIGWRVGRETAVEHSAILDEQLEDAIVALAPIYRLVAWSRENDRLALDRRLEGVEQERAKNHAEVEAQTERWRAEQAEARQKSQAEARARAEEARRDGPTLTPRRPSLSTLFSGKLAGDAPRRPRDGRPDSSPVSSSKPATPRPPSAPTPRPASASAPVPAPSPAARADAARAEEPTPPSPRLRPAPAPATLEKGARVRVRSGPFADKIGVVGELDGRGGARVLLGLLSTKLDVTELEPAVETRERPAMQSSHRRPLAPAPRKAR